MRVENADWRGSRLVVKRYVLVDALRVAADRYTAQSKESAGNVLLAEQFIWQAKTAIELAEVFESQDYDTLRLES